MNEQETVLAGKIGLLISIFLWLLCSWRLVFHLCWELIGWPGREGEDGRQHSQSQQVSILRRGAEAQQQRSTVPCIRWITRRRAFHGLLWMAALCEVVSYADLSGIVLFTSDRKLAENIGYVLLNVVGRTFELLAFCTVTEIWLRTAIDARPRSMDSRIISQNFWLHWLPNIFVLFTALLVLASVSLSVVIFCRFPHAPTREYVLVMPLSMLQTLLEATFWGIHVLIVVLSINMTSKCILVLVPSTEWKRRLYLLGKAVVPMLVSCFAYATRCGWLIVAYMGQDRRDTWAWWISFAWTPTVAVSVMLLYSTRKRDSTVEEFVALENDADDSNIYGNSDDTSNSIQQSLLRPQPPEEAFRAFHIFRRGEEDINDSFCLSSPLPCNELEAVVGDDASVLSTNSTRSNTQERNKSTP